MSTADRYAVPTTDTTWNVKQQFTSTFRWEYEDGRASLLGLYEKGNLTEGERARLKRINVELDEAWDLLRQRRAKREFGQDPDDAELRPPRVVENYEG